MSCSGRYVVQNVLADAQRFPSRGRAGTAPESRMARVTRVNAPREASWDFAEAYRRRGRRPRDRPFARRRGRLRTPIGAGGGAALRFLAALTDARAVVEVGTGTGVSALWLLRGMRPDGVLTSIDVEGEHQRLARQAPHRSVGIAPEPGPPHQRPRARRHVPVGRRRLRPRASIDGEKSEYAAYYDEALRLLRPGGVVAFDNASVARPRR